MATHPRIELLDWARGLALVAMTIFHFAFDLELFGVQEPGFISQPHWKYFARAIASTFLFLTGFSLYLAHHESVSWKKWNWRMAKIAGAALVITLATFFATPEQYIFFSILHQIAFASLVGLLFLSLPWLVVLAAGIGVFAVGQSFETTLLDHWSFWWTGLSAVTPVSSDYVPVFPWFSAPLVGIAAAKLAQQRGWLDALAKPQMISPPSRLLKFMGRKSLVYYLLHQPVMIALLLGTLWLTGRVTFGT